MTRGETIRELNKYIESEKNYESARIALEECESKILSISVDYETPRVKATHDPDKLSAVIDRLIKLRREYIDAADEASRTMERVYGLIKRVTEPTSRSVLVRRYISGETWESIARELSYSWSGIHKVHERGIAEIMGGGRV